MNEIEPVDVEKVSEENPNSRFRVTNAAILNPGVCALCGSAGGDGRQFIDFGKTMDWYGVVYFCTWCVAEAAKLLGFVTSEQHVKNLHENEALILKYGNEKLEVERLQEQLNAARLLLRNCNCIVTYPVGGDSVPDAMVVEDSEESDGDNDNDGESDGVKGSDDISESPEDIESEPVKRSRSRKSAE